MAVDIVSRKPKIGNVFGGLSGPAIRPLTMRLVYMAAAGTGIPVIASGGIGSVADALEYLVAGARAVCIGTGMFADAGLPVNVVEGISAYLEKNRMRQLSDVIGSLQ